jgi:hypothetical protein
MASLSWPGPRLSIDMECRRRGRQAFTAGCMELLAGRTVDDSFVDALAGPGRAAWLLTGAPEARDYWARTWGARGLLWAWDPAATTAVVAAMRDEAWRVREMAAKVAARHLVGDALPAVAALRDDPVARVRIAAERAVVAITAAGA